MELRGGVGVVDEAVELPGLSVRVMSRPFAEASAGGDVHFLSTCATGRIARVLVADVAGHGADVADIASALRDLMSRYINVLDQRRFFQKLNDKLAAMLQGGKFATAVVMTYFAPTRTLSISNAGHPPPLLYQHAEQRWSYAQASASLDRSAQNLPLGVISASRYSGFDIELRPGDIVLCYTDCVSECRRADGELLTNEELLELVMHHHTDDLRGLVHGLCAELGRMHPGNLEQDDLTLVAFRPNEGARVVSLADRAAAPMRMLRGVVREGHLAMPDLTVANVGGALLNPLSHWRGRRRTSALE